MRPRSEASEAGAFTKFRLLMWKNFLQQWRHPIQTLVELLLPVLTMSIVLILRWQVEPTQQDALTYPVIPAHSLNYSNMVLAGMNISEMSIVYSPTSPELDDVVRSAVINLLVRNARDLIPILEETVPGLLPPSIVIPPDININSTEIIDVVKSLIRVTAYNSSDDLRGIYLQEETTRKVIAAVQFDESLRGALTLPDVVSYSLRFPERPRLNSFYSQGGRSWRTELVFPPFDVPGPRFPYSHEGGNDPGYVNEMFIALQNAISMEIISRKTGENLTNFDINLQRFPHPPYVMDLAVEAMQMLLPVFISLSLSYTIVNITRAVTVEKELQLKETMKIMGLPTWLHWTAWFCKQFIYLFIASILLVILLKVNWFTNEDGFSDYAVFTNTPWTVMFFYIVLYLTCAIFFAFMVSGLFSTGNRAALFTSVIWFMSGIPAVLLTMEGEVSAVTQTLTCLSINSAMAYGFQLLLGKEGTGGMQWGEFFDTPTTESTRFTFGHVVIMLLVDCVLYMLIALYLEQVLPGPYGTPQKWYFIFQASFWCPNRGKYDGEVIYADLENDDVLMEKDPIGHPVGVKITNLTKVYGSQVAVNHLTMNIYDNQITVLLGHNGAGKSTTISMLTGNLEATHGSVIVAGYNISTQARFARAHLGLCPQHNVLFNELTVAEHLEFFARLKGFKGQELKEDIDSLIDKLELNEKRDYPSHGLSGGQKRRLCVGIAMSGAAKVVLLDEPTSGMDPASRRALWDLLQKEKQGRSMILTTHFMDEADFLGDRVAIMAQGRLQCVGSPHFLKRHHGVGYSLVVGKQEYFDLDACTELVSRYIPGIAIKDDRGTEVTYSLLNEHAHLFEEMLTDLEQNVNKIKYNNYGLIATTLEDVFMSLGADVALVHSVSEDGTATIDSTNEGDSLEQLNSIGGASDITGFRLLCQRVLAVWMKLGLVWLRSWGMVVMQFAVPVVLINMTLLVSNYVMAFVDGNSPRNLTIAVGYARTETLLTYNGTSLSALGALAKSAYEYIFANSGVSSMSLTLVNDTSLEDYYMERASDPTALGSLRHRMLIGATFEEDSATAHFSNFGYHDVATSLAAVHSAILQARSPASQIHVYNQPIEATYSNQNNMQLMVSFLAMQLANGIGSTVAIVSAVFIMFYIRERACGAKLLQKAAGLQPAVLWFSSSVFDWLWFLVISQTILLSLYAFNVMGLSTGPELGRLFLVIMVFGAAMVPMNYLFSLMFTGPAVGFVVVFFINVILGSLGPQIVEALAIPQLDTKEASDILDAILQIFPLYSFVISVRRLNQVEMTVQSCLQLCDYLEAVMSNVTSCSIDTMCEVLPSTCCIRENTHFEWEEPGILRYITMMLVSCAILWAVLMLVEYRVFRRLFTFKKSAPPLDLNSLDKDVVEEMRHVESIGKGQLPQHGLVARGLTKYYGKHLAVDQIGFSVNDTECFGLLGVNGAGKTTTFKMLMGDESISSGHAYIGGHSVETQLTRVHEHIGYCPQFDALFNELTGRETLQYFSMLRGLSPRAAGLHAAVLATSLGFLPHLDKRVGQYSGGTKRKLNTAVSFLGRTRLVFVDEPTTGVDPAAKRHVWRAVRGVQKSGRGVVLTSHSMEECEALCSRLTIMVNGRFQCLGTPQHLKNKFSEGFTLTIKQKIEDVRSTGSTGPATQAIKDYVTTNFVNPKIMEEYEGVLTYYLPDTSVAWSKMFGIMERAKRELDVEYYSISQTTLEQIFLQFTKYQKQEQK